jgi:hypothetical protein
MGLNGLFFSFVIAQLKDGKKAKYIQGIQKRRQE